MSPDNDRSFVPVPHYLDPYDILRRSVPQYAVDPAILERHPGLRVGTVEIDTRPCPFCLNALPTGERDTKDGPTVIILRGELRWGCTLCVLAATGKTFLGEGDFV